MLPVIDFAMDIVEIEGEPRAKRGKRSGIKQVYRLICDDHRTLPVKAVPPAGAVPLLIRFIDNGRIVMQSEMQEARKRVHTWLKQTAKEKKTK